MSSWREQVSDDTRIMLDDLIKLKEKTQAVTTKQDNWTAITAIVSAVFLIYVIYFIVGQSETNPLLLAAAFISTWPIVGILGLSGLFFGQIILRNKVTSTEKHFEKLRHEVIDHLASPWFRIQHSSLRDEVSREMESYEINVRYKSE